MPRHEQLKDLTQTLKPRTIIEIGISLPKTAVLCEIALRYNPLHYIGYESDSSTLSQIKYSLENLRYQHLGKFTYEIKPGQYDETISKTSADLILININQTKDIKHSYLYLQNNSCIVLDNYYYPKGKGYINLNTQGSNALVDQLTIEKNYLPVKDNFNVIKDEKSVSGGQIGLILISSQANYDIIVDDPIDLNKSVPDISFFLAGTGGYGQIIRNFSSGLLHKLYPKNKQKIKEQLFSPTKIGLNFKLSKTNVIWGILRGTNRIIEACEDLGKDYLLVDHSYLRKKNEKKGERFRVSLNGTQNTSFQKCPSDRWEELEIALQPWKKQGNTILICPPTDATSTFYGLNQGNTTWLSRTTEIIKKTTNKAIKVRHKPSKIYVKKSNTGIWPTREEAVINKNSLQKDLEDAFCVVTFNSNVAVEAIIAGVPAFVSEHSIAASVCETDLTKIESPIYFDRLPWLHNLAYSQFSLKEINNGEIWDILNRYHKNLSAFEEAIHSPRKFAVITTFNDDGYKKYGKQMIETFETYWPKNIILYVYYEGHNPKEDHKGSNIKYINILEVCPELKAFKEKWNDDPIANGRLPSTNNPSSLKLSKQFPKNEVKSFKWDAVRFSHKSLCWAHAGLTLKEDVLLWVDADVKTFRHIPNYFFENLIDPKVYCSYLGRKKIFTETGFLAFNLKHPYNKEFMEQTKYYYTSGKIFKLKEWHDCEVFDVIRTEMTKEGKITGQNLSPVNDTSHPFINSDLGKYMDHLKGPRKTQGISNRVELKNNLHVDYWKNAK